MELPRELYEIIIRHLSSKDRSTICLVSRLFERISLMILKLKNDPYEYHSIVRSKNKSWINLDIIYKSSDIDLVKLMIEKGANNWNCGFYIACSNGYQNIIELMIEKGANNLNDGLYCACQGGQQSIVELLIKKGANNWNLGNQGACENGHQSIVELMIEKGADNWNWGLTYACVNKHESIIKLMIEKGAYKCHYCNKSINNHLNNM